MQLELTFGEGSYGNGYKLVLAPNADDALFVKEEWTYYHDRRRFSGPTGSMIGSNTPEAKLPDDKTSVPTYVRHDLESYRVYHFHDTSNTAAVKLMCQVDDNRFLRPDAGNLAAFLYFLKQKHPETLRNIEDTVRQIAPFFENFILEPSRNNAERIRLEWKEMGSEVDPENWTGRIVNPNSGERSPCQRNVVSTVPSSKPRLGLMP